MGLEITPSMSSIFREKLHPQTYRSLVLEAKQFTGVEALDEGLVDAVGDDLAAVVAFIKEKKLVGKGKGKVYHLIRNEMYRETMRLLQIFPTEAGFQREELKKAGLPEWTKL